MELKSVYIMKCGEICKIGVSKNPKKRLKVISLGNPNTELIWESKEVYNAYKIESSLHKKYSSSSVGREWFLIEDTEELIKEAESMIEEEGKNECEKEIPENSGMSNLISKILGVDALMGEIEEIKLENKRIQDFTYYMLGIQKESDYAILIYESAFGENGKQLSEKYALSMRDGLENCFGEEELKRIRNAEMLVVSLMGYGWGYNEIKDFIMDKSTNKIAA